ncbi:MAG: PBP1A family penicillin-binding protein [Flavobacteriales bacterium]|nr:PBP1A family penicillin-binding protein [Flavobacteriales bacterium]
MGRLGLFGPLPSFKDLEDPRSQMASLVYSADGQVLGKYYIQNRSPVTYQQLSPALVDALIATEDERFYKHSGIDVEALLRAIFGVVTGQKKGGGSTITQQLAKNLFHEVPRSKIKRAIQKIKEWIIAMQLERSYTKSEILAMYLNTADFGHQIFGVATAAYVFFNKKPSELATHEAALLVGLLKAPTFYSPLRHPERSRLRRNTVLDQMVKNNKLDPEEAERLKAMPLLTEDKGLAERIRKNQLGVGELAPYFLAEVRKDLLQWCKSHINPRTGEPYNLYTDGLRIYTTIDSHMQRYAEDAVRQYMQELQQLFFSTKRASPNGPFDSRLKKEEIQKILEQSARSSPRYRAMREEGMSDSEILRFFRTQKVPMRVFSYKGERDTLMTPWDSLIYYKYYLQVGLVSMENKTGHIKAWVGGIDYSHFKFDHVREAKRQVGSTFKPFVYAMAMQEGISPCFMVPNTRVCIGDWCPSNANDYKEGQMISLKEALANSVNYISAYLMKKYGPHAIIQLVRKMGITADIPPVPSICLGTPEITVLEMTSAFSVFGNKGMYVKPQYLLRIEDQNGNLVEEFFTERHEAMDERSAFLTLALMKGVVESGTGSRLRYRYKFNFPVAGKTGTTQNNSDGWFIGITPDITTGVWVGADERTVRFGSTYYGQGANTALPIWALYMLKVYQDNSLKYHRGDFEPPPGELRTKINCAEWRPEEQEQNTRIIENFDNLPPAEEVQEEP